MNDSYQGGELAHGDRSVYAATTANRLMIADVLEGLEPSDWQQDSLCEGWTVHTVAAHLLQPMLIGFGRFFLTALRYRGNTDRVVDHVTRTLARRTSAEIITLLRARAADEVSPPRVGPMGPFAETCLHLQDIAVPLGLAHDVPYAHWEFLLEYLVSGDAAPALVGRASLDGVRLEATDGGWSHGAGLEVRGRARDLGMVLSGRSTSLQHLRGPGVAALQSQVP